MYFLLAIRLRFELGFLNLRLLTTEEVYVSKLLHLVNVTAQCNLFVVEKDPAWIFADKCNVVARMDRRTLVADDGLKSEMCRSCVLE